VQRPSAHTRRGENSITWNGKAKGRPAAPGAYTLTVTRDVLEATTKVTLTIRG